MKNENNFFERCFGIVANLKIENENQIIAKEVVLDEIRNLQQENSLLKEDIKGFEQERQTLYNTIHDLQKANKQLNRKRKKAIEYIEENKLNTNKISEMLCGSEVMTLLEILEGDNE